MLSELLDVSESDADAVAAASYLNHKQRDEKMADLYRDFKEWKTATVRASKNAGSDFISKVKIQILSRLFPVILCYHDHMALGFAIDQHVLTNRTHIKYGTYFKILLFC